MQTIPKQRCEMLISGNKEISTENIHTSNTKWPYEENLAGS